MKRYLTILFLLLAVVPVFAQNGRKNYVIGFYNLENLFDTYHDEGKNDYEYLPDGANEWTDFKYAKKLSNMRAAGSDHYVHVAPPFRMSLEEALEYIAADEYVEVTPKNIRLRKQYLSELERKKIRYAKAAAAKAAENGGN